MSNKKTIRGEFPHKGMKIDLYFKDDEGNAVDEKQATNVEIVEFDVDGKPVARTYGAIQKGGPGIPVD